ncbi:MAG: hypothetical protein KAW95_04185 [Dehalococcoidia bacterium]|nr:hypothetical protein [Dehalococcoidia bacterium]
MVAVDMAWYRDLVICISGVVAAVVLIVVAVLFHSLCRRITAALDSVEKTSDRAESALDSIKAASDRVSSVLDSIESIPATIRGISSEVRTEAVKPLARVAAVVQGVREGIDTVGRLFRGREGGKHGAREGGEHGG